MENRRVIIFFITGIILCLIILLAGRENRRFLVAPDKTSTYLVTEVLDDVRSVVIEHSGTRIEVQREGSRWRMTAPIEATVDNSMMKRLIKEFGSATISDALDFDEIDGRGLSINDYGLHPARSRVIFSLARHELSFLFGKKTASGTNVYLRKDNLNKVLVVSRTLYDAIPTGVDELRSRRLIECDRNLVSTVTVRRPGHPFIKLILKEGSWVMEEPVCARASQEKVHDFIEKLSAARVTEFIWPSLSNVMDVAEYELALKTRKALYGLDDDTGTTITIQTLDGSGDVALVIGRGVGNNGDAIHVLLDNGRAIGKITGSIAHLIDVTAVSFRSMRIFDALPAPVKRLDIVVDTEAFVLSHTNQLWQIDSPVSEPADQQFVQRTIDTLLSMKAEQIRSHAHEDEASARKADAGYVALSVGDQTIVASIKKTDYRGELYEFEFADKPEVYYVAESNMPPALIDSAALLDFRDKTILAIPEQAVQRVTLRRFNETFFTAEFIEDSGSWHLGAGDFQGRVNQQAFSRLLALLTDLKADRVVKVGFETPDLEYYGFATPWLEVTLDLNLDDAIRRSLLVGRSDGNNLRYVMARGDQSIFLVEEQKLALFTSSLTVQEGDQHGEEAGSY